MKYLRDSILREVRRMASSPVYLMMMVVVPLGCALFFMSLLGPALPTRVPTAVVDLDHSPLSRSVTRSLTAIEMVDIQMRLEDYNAALDQVRKGTIFGFFIIPPRFEEDALAGRTPTLEYYTNMTYFVPGTLSFKGFKTIAVTTAGGVVSAKLSSYGLTSNEISPLVQPVVIDAHGIGNPWLNYSYYLTPSFTYATLALLIMIFTAYSVTVEIKHGTSPQWLQTAGGSMQLALAGKLLPQTVVYIIVCFAVQALMFGFMHFPMNGSVWGLLGATALFVMASQSFAVMVCCLLPNPRLSLSVISLLGVLSFSFCGFSYPVESMYGAIAIFSYLMPVRYLFLIYVNTALNGFDIYYVRYCYAALLAMLYLGMLFSSRLKKACLTPVYIP